MHTFSIKFSQWIALIEGDTHILTLSIGTSGPLIAKAVTLKPFRSNLIYIYGQPSFRNSEIQETHTLHYTKVSSPLSAKARTRQQPALDGALQSPDRRVPNRAQTSRGGP
jgi:hypothetical protein